MPKFSSDHQPSPGLWWLREGLPGFRLPWEPVEVVSVVNGTVFGRRLGKANIVLLSHPDQEWWPEWSGPLVPPPG